MEVFETISVAEVPPNNPGRVLETLGDLSGRFESLAKFEYIWDSKRG